jgi:hypothetical protein
MPSRQPAGRRRYSTKETLRRLGDVGGLRALLSLGDLELDLIAFLKTLVTLRRDRAVMHEDIRAAIVATYEAIAFGVIKPLHRTFQTFHVRPLGHVLLQCEAVPCICGNCAARERALSRECGTEKPLFARL